MADTNLNITVTANDEGPKKLKAALKDLLAEVRLVELGFKRKTTSAGDAQLAFAKIEQKVKELGVSEKELVGINTSLFHAENRVTEGFRSMASEVKGIHNKMPGMRDQFRDFYREHRTGNRTMNEATQTVQMFGSMLGGEGLGKVVGTAIGGFQQMEFATNAIGISAVGAGGKMASFGQTLIGMAGPLAAVAGAAALVYLAFEQGKKITEEFNKAAQDFYKTLVAGGRISKEQQIGDLTKRINVLSQQQIGGPSLLTRGMGVMGSLKEFEERAAAYMRREAEINRLLNERAAIEKEITGEAEKQARARGIFTVGGSTVTGAARSLEKIGVRGIAGGMKIGKVGPGEVVPIETTFNAMDQAWLGFASSVEDGIGAMTRSIPSIGTAFAEAFGGAGTMLGSFVQQFMTSIQQMAIQAAALWAVSQIPVIGPLIAAFSGRAGGGPVSSGRPYVVGEKGPELFVPNRGGQIVSNAQAARFGGGSMASGMQTVHVIGVIRGNDIQLVNAKAGLSRRGRLM